MIKKFIQWLIERILPVWARKELLDEIQRLIKENEALRHKIALQDEYISGLESGMRAQRRIVIYTGGEKK